MDDPLREPLVQLNDPESVFLYEDLPSSPLQPSSYSRPPTGVNGLRQTVQLFIGIYVGLGLLSQHYAVREGGWLALFFLFGSCALFAASGLLVNAAIDLLPARYKDNRHLGYPELGEATLGGKGIVTVLAVMELFGGATITMLITWEQLELLLPSKGLFGFTALSAALAISCLFLLPLIALPNLSQISKLSAVGLLSSSLVIAAVLGLIGVDPHRQHQAQHPAAGHDIFLFPGILKSIGLFAVSMSGHSAIPALRSSIRKKEDFPRAIITAFATMSGLYGIMAACGYWYFGRASSAIITTDLATNSPYAPCCGTITTLPSWLAIDRVSALLVMVNCAAKLPALIMVLQEMGVGLIVGGDRDRDCGYHETPKQSVLFCFRLGIAVAAAVIAFTARNVLGNAISLVGGICGMSTSLLLPVLFYSKLAWKGIGVVQKVVLVVMGVGGVALLVLITSLNVYQMLGKDTL